MNRYGLAAAWGLVVGVLLVMVVVSSGHAGESCCSDRAVLRKGVQAAHQALGDGKPDQARQILENAARATRTPLADP